MSGLVTDAAAVTAAYAMGSVPVGLIVVRAVRGLYVREVGSGSMGSTNVLRAVGPAAAGATLALDVGKGVGAVLVARRLGTGSGAQVAAALAAAAGHSWPAGSGFRGGKSVATACGALMVIAPALSGFAIAAGVSALAVTRVVSVGSLTAAATATLGAGLIAARGGPRGPLVYATLASTLIVARHGDNLRRLARGAEPRVSFSRPRSRPAR